MPRSPAITYQEVADAAKTLLTQGSAPTIASVKRTLGDRGSPATISKHLKTWKAEAVSSSQQATQSQLPLVSQPAQPAQSDKAAPESTAKKTTEKNVKPKPQSNSNSNSQSDTQPETQSEKTTDKDANSNSNQKPKQNNHHNKNRHRKDKRRNNHNHNNPNSNHPNSNSNGNNNYHFGRTRKERTPEQRKQAEDVVEQVTQAFGDYYHIQNIERLDEKALRIQIRCLENALNKEQSRREAAERMAVQAKAYAEDVKAQVAQRINDLRHMMDEQVAFLKSELESNRKQALEDLEYYRSKLNKANDLLLGE